MVKLPDWQRKALEGLRTGAACKQAGDDRDLWAAILALTNAMVAMAGEEDRAKKSPPTPDL